MVTGGSYFWANRKSSSPSDGNVLVMVSEEGIYCSSPAYRSDSHENNTIITLADLSFGLCFFFVCLFVCLFVGLLLFFVVVVFFGGGFVLFFVFCFSVKMTVFLFFFFRVFFFFVFSCGEGGVQE